MKTSRLALRANPCGALHPRVPERAFSAGDSNFPLIFRDLRRLGGMFCFGLIALSARVAAETWDPNPETDIARYLVSYGTSPGVHPVTIDVGLNTNTTISGLVEGTTYYVVVTAVSNQGLHSEPSAEFSYKVPSTSGVPTEVMSRSGWTLRQVDSEEGGNFAATKAFDGDPGTFWHTAWTTGTTPPPHEIRIDLGSERPVSGFRYLPRQDGNLVGNIAQYECYVSLDGTTWGDPVASGTFAATSLEKEVLFATRDARYVMLRALSEVFGGNDCNIAELNILQPAGTGSPVNEAPVAASKAVATSEDAALAITLSASDADGQPLDFAIVGAPARGSLSGTPPFLTYTPAADFHGADSFTYKASDGIADSNTATVSITVNPVNDAPVAVGRTVATNEDTPVSIALSASDKEGNPLSYTILPAPGKGTLSGTAPNLTYTPAADSSGTDSFSFRVNDGTANSNTAVVSITVNAVNDAPVAVGRTVTTNEDTPVSIALSASDKEGNPLTYAILPAPGKGTLSGTAPNLTYTPAADSSGTDSFSFRVNDGTVNSNTAVVSITVNAVNDAPVAVAKSVTTAEDTPVAVVLSATDKEGSALTYAIASGPAKGTLSGSGPNLTYTPSANFSGADSFTYRANDGGANSNTATVTITVTEVTDAAVVSRDGWTLRYVDSEDAPDTPATQAFDGNPDTIWHTRWQSGSTPPPHEIQIDLGKLHVLEGFRYLPRQDGFTVGRIAGYQFHTSLDGTSWGSPVATGTFANSADEKEVVFAAVSARYIRLRATGEVNGTPHTSVAELNVLGTVAANQPPAADSQNLNTPAATPVAIALTASDPNGGTLAFAVVSGPANGTLAGTAPDLTYTPDADFSGVDSFTFQASDGSNISNLATVVIHVTEKSSGPSNQPPVFKANPISLGGATVSAAYRGEFLTDFAGDPDKGDSLTFAKISGPAWLEISANGKLSGTPPAGSAGVDRFIVRATDKAGAADESVLLIEIDGAGLPLPWEMEEIGESRGKPSARHRSGTYILEASGTFGGSSDATGFLWQTLSGDGEIIARVNSIDDGGKNTRAGVMIRDSLSPNSGHVFIGVNGGGDFRWARRIQKGRPSVTKTAGSGAIPNAWVRLVRKGDTITAYKSADGSEWQRVGTSNVEFGKHCYIGLATSGGRENTASAAFRSVTVEN